MEVQVWSAYVAGKHCADIEIPHRQPCHLERRNRNDLERAVLRHIAAAVQPRNDVTVKWCSLRSVL